MAKKILLLLAMCLAGAACFMAGDSRAYDFTFTNAMKQSDGIPVVVVYHLAYGGDHRANDHNPLPPEQSWTVHHGGWESGLCLSEVKYKIGSELPGCESGNLKGTWFYKRGLWCGNKTVVFSRRGCALEADFKSSGNPGIAGRRGAAGGGGLFHCGPGPPGCFR